MCACTPAIRTPFCGKIGCQWPAQIGDRVRERVIAFAPEDAVWPFHGEPYFWTRDGRGYRSQIKFDPFPCYGHDRSLVAEVLEAVETRFPVGEAPDYYLIPFEDPGRTNGYATQGWYYPKDGERVQLPYVVLNGKRIPIHPAMTRYLVAHEYGHVAQWWIERQRGMADRHPHSDLLLEYAALRGIRHPENDYGGHRWHKSIGELFANDFRIIVTGFEPEFWPHPGFARPEHVSEVGEFWERAVAEWAHDTVKETP